MRPFTLPRQKSCPCLIFTTKEIEDISFATNFSNLTDFACVQLFRFKREDTLRIVPLSGLPAAQKSTKIKEYSTHPFISTSVEILRMETTDRWFGFGLLLRKDALKLSEIFRGELQKFMDKSTDLVRSPISREFLAQHPQRYAIAVFYKTVAWTKLWPSPTGQ